MPSATPRRTSATHASIPACAARDTPGGRRRERLSARVPGAARAEEERHLDACLGAERRHLADLGVREHHHAAALRDAAHGDGRRSASSSTASSTRGPSTEGISMR